MGLLIYHNLARGNVLAFTTDATGDYSRGAAGFPGLASVGIKEGVIFPKQVHGDVIWDVSPADLLHAGVVEADAVVTCVRGLPVAIRTADCLPLLLYAPDRQVIAAVHAGWKSTRLEIARKTVALLVTRYGVDPARLQGIIGPCIRSENYPVGAEFKEYFPEDAVFCRGTLCLDIPRANKRQLVEAGVPAGNIADAGHDSYADRTYHSFRRDRDKSGRMLSCIKMI